MSFDRDKYELGLAELKIDDILRVAYHNVDVSLSDEAKNRLRVAADYVSNVVDRETGPIYSINTGFGSLKDVRIEDEHLLELQRNIIRSHAVGSGEVLPIPQARAMMLLRLQTVIAGHSGVRIETAQLVCDMLNNGITPVVPQQGSVGACGDLSPLAHMALAMLGEGEVFYEGRRMEAKRAFDLAGLVSFTPVAKEGLALVNGTQMMTAVGIFAWHHAMLAAKHADIAAAMTLEATFGSYRAYDKRVQAVRPHPGQNICAANMRKMTKGSEIYESHKDCDRVQDAYSIRCAPQVHGSVRDMMSYVRGVLETEVSSVTDNPILFPEDDEIISAGNFHGQPVAIALDALGMVVVTLSSISERRSFRMLDPKLSELPNSLIENSGLHSGLSMLQVLAASIVNESKTLAHPSSIDSIPTWADQEDHVSMGANAARKAFQIAENAKTVIAVELICAAQGLEYRKPLKPAKGVQAAYTAIRKAVEPLHADRYLAPDIERMRKLISSGKILEAVEREIGEIA